MTDALPLLTPAEIETAFPAHPVRIRATPGYLLRMLLVLSGLILMQILYLALIVAVLAAGGFWLVVALNLPMRANALTLVIYAGPPLAALILTFFLCKPLFASPPKPPEPIQLDPQRQPVLYAYIQKLCRTLGAPMPRQIHCDLRANASAGFQGWSGFFLGNLVLTIGLPLVSGLTLAEFTGVLAHEFGHFTQSAGMRMYFLIQHIQLWFARVVHDRDGFDEWLDHGHDGEDYRVGLVRLIARGGVWVSRRYLALLMRGGQWISAAFSREMEFNADQYETAIAGADHFASTSFRLAELEAALAHTWQNVNVRYQIGELPDDIPLLMTDAARRIGEPVRLEIRGQIEASRTGRWDSHPATPERIQAARKSAIQGDFRLAGPASRLFADFEELSSRVTQAYLANELGEHYHRAAKVPSAQWIAEMDREQAYANAVTHWLGEPGLAIDWYEAGAKASIETELNPVDPAAVDAYRDAWTAREELFWVKEFGKLGVPVEEFANTPDLDAAYESARSKQSECAAHLVEQAGPAAARIRARLATNPACADAWNAWRALEAVRGQIPPIRDRLVLASRFQMHAGHFAGMIAVTESDAYLNGALERIKTVLEDLGGVPSVVTLDPNRPAALAAQLEVEDSAGDPSRRVSLFLNRWEQIAIRTLGRLCALLDFHQEAEKISTQSSASNVR